MRIRNKCAGIPPARFNRINADEGYSGFQLFAAVLDLRGFDRLDFAFVLPRRLHEIGYAKFCITGPHARNDKQRV
jgi:hypothetical protein